MRHVVVASINPVKITAVQDAFCRMFPEETFTCTGIKVPSGVADQPFGDDEMLRGAQNRVHNARKEKPDADFWVGLEGGAFEQDGKLGTCAWAVVLGRHQEGMARTVGFILPDAVATLVRQGMELGDADDIVFKKKGSKQVNGAIGLLTGDVLTRGTEYANGVIMALAPFKNPELYPKK